jgi:hypothetical protein
MSFPPYCAGSRDCGKDNAKLLIVLSGLRQELKNVGLLPGLRFPSPTLYKRATKLRSISTTFPWRWSQFFPSSFAAAAVFFKERYFAPVVRAFRPTK